MKIIKIILAFLLAIIFVECIRDLRSDVICLKNVGEYAVVNNDTVLISDYDEKANEYILENGIILNKDHTKIICRSL